MPDNITIKEGTGMTEAEELEKLRGFTESIKQ